MLKPITEDEQDYSIDGGGLVISEARLSLVVDDHEVAAVAAIIGTHARIGMGQSGMIYVSPIQQLIPIGRDRKSVVEAKSVTVRVDRGGRRSINQKKNQHIANEPKYTK